MMEQRRPRRQLARFPGTGRQLGGDTPAADGEAAPVEDKGPEAREAEAREALRLFNEKYGSPEAAEPIAALHDLTELEMLRAIELMEKHKRAGWLKGMADGNEKAFKAMRDFMLQVRGHPPIGGINAPWCSYSYREEKEWYSPKEMVDAMRNYVKFRRDKVGDSKGKLDRPPEKLVHFFTASRTSAAVPVPAPVHVPVIIPAPVPAHRIPGGEEKAAGRKRERQGEGEDEGAQGREKKRAAVEGSIARKEPKELFGSDWKRFKRSSPEDAARLCRIDAKHETLAQLLQQAIANGELMLMDKEDCVVFSVSCVVGTTTDEGKPALLIASDR